MRGRGYVVRPGGLMAYVKHRGLQRTKLFPLDASPARIAIWRGEQRLELEKLAASLHGARGTFGEDVERYLAKLTGRLREPMLYPAELPARKTVHFSIALASSHG